MQGAERLREFRMDGHQSYAMKQFTGEGWLMVGDAAFFIDPIFSSGISDGMQMAKFAAAVIADALAADGSREEQFAAYERRLRGGVLVWQKLVELFYEVAPIFGRVVAESEHRHRLLRLCEGDVFDPSAEQTLGLLQRSFDEIREVPDHPLHHLLVEASTE